MDDPKDYEAAVLDAVMDTGAMKQRLEKFIADGDMPGMYETLVPDVAFLSKVEIAAFKARAKKGFGRDFTSKDFDAAVKDEIRRTRTGMESSDTRTDDDYRNYLDMTQDGKVGDCLQNAAAVLRHHPEWKGKLAYDEFKIEIVALEDTPVSKAGAWAGHEDSLTTEWMQRVTNVRVSPKTVATATTMVAKENRFHPVMDYLNGLSWDGESRIDTWLNDYFGVKEGNYTAAVGSKWLISAVARIFEPGCKVDTCLILEGLQGEKKSTSLKTLGGKWFTDEIADLGSKDSSMQMMGAWILEISELDAMSRSEVSKVKSFMSRATERFRPPYEAKLIEVPRQCVFAGTVNEDKYLTDSTGNRRFWPVHCAKNDYNGLKVVRDQLWAEAVVKYTDGVQWWLTDDQEVEARVEQDERRVVDPIVNILQVFLENKGIESFIPTRDLLKEVCGERTGTSGDAKRVASAMHGLNWKSKTERRDRILMRGYRFGGDLNYHYLDD